MSEGSTAAKAPPKANAKAKDQKKADTRTQNILAAKALSDLVRTSLGPRGMDKMIQQSNGQVLITNDGATILKKMEVVHPVARMLVEISKAQDVEAGDGTTTVVVMAGAFLQACSNLLDKGIHPSHISDGFEVAFQYGLRVIEEISQPIDLSNRDSLIQNCITSLSSKVVSQHSDFLAPMAVDSVLHLINVQTPPQNVDLRNILISKKLGATVDESMFVQGLIFADNRPSHSAGGPTQIKNAKIGLIQFCLSAPKTDMDNNIVVNDYAAMDRVLKEQRKYILGLVKKIYETGCNVILIQKSVLRDAVNDLSLHFLAKRGIMVIRDIERDQVEYISKTIGAQPVAHIDYFTKDKLGSAQLVEEKGLGGGGSNKVVFVRGVPNKKDTISILLRGSNQLVLDEAERSLHDALCVVRSLVKRRSIVPGGAAIESELSQRILEYSRSLKGIVQYVVREYAQALEAIPYTLAENAGLDPMSLVTQLKNQHVKGDKLAGLNLKKVIIKFLLNGNQGVIMNMVEQNIIQPSLVTMSALTLSTECVRMILKIDDVVLCRP